MAGITAVTTAMAGVTAVIKQPTRSLVVSQNFVGTPNVALSQVQGVTTSGVENGYALVYNSATGNFEPKAIVATAVSQITGGSF
jgi:hypothetical protein